MRASRLLTLVLTLASATAESRQLHVSENHHYLVTETGAPFFWLGDTVRESFHRSNRESATRYLETRTRLGFTAVQVVAIAEFDGHTDPNAYGYLPLTDLDPARPAQVQHARHLLESRPFLTRVPDDSMIVETDVPTAMPGAGTRHFADTRDSSDGYAMIYAPVGRAFRVRVERLSGSTLRAAWFNPRDGSARSIGTFPRAGDREVVPPNPGEPIDWVLVLDDVARRFPAPGAH